MENNMLPVELVKAIAKTKEDIKVITSKAVAEERGLTDEDKEGIATLEATRSKLIERKEAIEAHLGIEEKYADVKVESPSDGSDAKFKNHLTRQKEMDPEEEVLQFRSALRDLALAPHKSGKVKEYITQKRAFLAGTATQGSEFVPTRWYDDYIVERNKFTPCYNLVHKWYPKGANAIKLPVMGGLDAAVWGTAETSGGTLDTSTDTSDIDFAPVALTAKVAISDTLLRYADYPIEDIIKEAMVTQMAEAIETGICSGTGSSQPSGLFLASSLSGNQTAAPLTIIGCKEVVKDLEPQYHDGAVWIMSPQMMYQFDIDASTTGEFLWNKDSVNGFAPTLLGFPIVRSSKAPTAIGDGNYASVLGNPMNYRWVEVLSMRFLVEEDFANNRYIYYIRLEADGKVARASGFRRHIIDSTS
jgi:HK97 family phage major capsid protein